jgi:hypothetical protein
MIIESNMFCQLLPSQKAFNLAWFLYLALINEAAQPCHIIARPYAPVAH